MNWGRSIILVLIIFMGFITILAIKMTYSKDDAFDKDYYEKGLAFDQEYDLKQNVINDQVTPSIILNDSTLLLVFKSLDQGSIKFKRPSDKTKDILLNIDASTVTIPRTKFEKGEWRLVINWSASNKNYLFEKSLYIP
nr:FixH family protein [Pseudopedobacter sp.]